MTIFDPRDFPSKNQSNPKEKIALLGHFLHFISDEMGSVRGHQTLRGRVWTGVWTLYSNTRVERISFTYFKSSGRNPPKTQSFLNSADHQLQHYQFLTSPIPTKEIVRHSKHHGDKEISAKKIHDS